MKTFREARIGQPPIHNAPPQDTRPALLVLLLGVSVGLVLLVAIIGMIVMMLGTGAVAQPAHQTTTAPITPSAALVASTAVAANPTPAPASEVTSPALPTATTHTYRAAPPMTINRAHRYTATITTPRGVIVITLLPDIAPQTVNNFVFLARQNFYNGLTWHRVIPGFIAQGGDPTGDGSGGPGYAIPAEFTDKIRYDTPGILAMARAAADPNSAGSQFFITTAPAPTLNSLYTIFGRVIAGQDIVDGIPLRDPNSATTPGETILGITIIENE
jgi:peptidylprolyl isomerase